jgi:hypothetical protein
MSTPDTNDDEQTLQERVAELERENNALSARLDAMARKQAELIDLVIGDEPMLTEDDIQAMEPVREQLQQLDGRVEDAAQTASAAMANGKTARSDGGETTKKDVAIRESRDELVRQVAYEGASAPTITVAEVEEQAKPQTELAYQTVEDAWTGFDDSLENVWDAFKVVDGSGDTKRLLLASDDISRELAHTVEQSLGRDGLTKRLISDQTEGGA